MTSERDDLSDFVDAYLDYREGSREQPPALDDLTEGQRRAAEAFIASITATRGVDPYASRPSIEQLLASRHSNGDRTREFGAALQGHLRQTVDQRALVTPDAASAAMGLASALVVHAQGVRMRVVPEATPASLESALGSRAEAIARVFGSFPDTNAVLYTSTGQEPLAVVVDRGDVHGAIETPSGETHAPRLPRPITDAGMACELWLRGMIPEFEPLDASLLEAAFVADSSLDPYFLARRAVADVSSAGARAQIGAKRATWQSFGDQEAQRLAVIVQEAHLGQFSEEGYKSHLDELVGRAA